VKGQLTHASRLQAGWIVVVDGAKATVRETGASDWETPLDDVVDRLTG
jgi:hypothetical protein